MSRRAFLVSVVGAVVAGCTRRRHEPAAADPDAPALAAARSVEEQLLAAHPPGSPAYDAHLAHLDALGGSTASPVPTPLTGPGRAADTAAVERASVAVLQAAAEAARGGATAALLASIAASHAALAAAGS